MSLSILINNYNYAQFLPQAIASALEQVKPGDEILVMDDGSTDDSAAVLAAYDNVDFVRVYRQANAGQFASVCHSIEKADGDVLLFLDADDYFLPGYLEHVRNFHRQDANLDYLFVKPLCVGGQKRDVESMAGSLSRMEFPSGVVLNTRIAAIACSEFVSSPTSGVSMKKRFALGLVALRAQLSRQRLSSASEGDKNLASARADFSFDGVAARYSSAVNAKKVYSSFPGFAYRIHGSNRFARLSRLQRRAVNRHRKRHITEAVLSSQAVAEHGGLSLEAVSNEVIERTWPLRRERCLHLHLNYLLVVPEIEAPLLAKLTVSCQLIVLAIYRFIKPASRTNN